MEGPTQLTITRMVDNRRQIYISPEAERIISNLQPRSVDVVAVVGPMRKGKSHLANLLCKRKAGFPLGDKLESETKDFWFWIVPHPVQIDRYLMVIDTEGLGDYSDEEQNEKDMKNLVLATLLSNHLVFNLQGNPDHSFVSNLRLMGDLADRIRVQKDGNDDGSNLGEHFPGLWVTVQQAHLKPPERNGKPLTPDEFLEDMLKRKDGHTKSIRSHNEMTDAVKAFFPKRHLRMIPAPSIDTDVLSNLDKVTDNELQKKYMDTVGKLTHEIWNSGQVKRVNGDDIKTTGLIHAMKYYVDAINDPNAVPSVIGAHEAMVEGECRRASNECMKQFQKTVEKKIKPLMPTDEETCNRRITTAAEDAVSKLTPDVGKWDKDGTWKEGLQEKMEAERLGLLKINGSKSKDVCEKIMGEADKSVRQKVESGGYNRVGGFDMYVKDMEGVIRTYNQKASGKGPSFEKVLKTFRATEETRRNTIKHAARKAEEDDSRFKEEQKKRREAEEAKERVAERERQARAEAERANERLMERAQGNGGGMGAADVAGMGLYAVGQGLRGMAYLLALALEESARRNNGP
ncbi:guanylate-binding protein 2-like [Branchiostoma floridae]|uniref:Guanylate-binding protein 2-like n=1 Tax=Branchiostoma floridae TaxID=7739 RepID=A0A9J7HSA8_BRAFL|nr:guanylate-binding protein 2-like [Branchiostoma floridae]